MRPLAAGIVPSTQSDEAKALVLEAEELVKILSTIVRKLATK
jgi:hypothetical protein